MGVPPFDPFDLVLSACIEVNSGVWLLIKRVKGFQFIMVSLQIHPLAGDTMNSKLLIMNSTIASFITRISCD